MHWLNKQKCSIICLQAVHVRSCDKKYLKQKVLTLAKVKKRGVVLYVKEELKPKKIWQDSDGKMLAVEINIECKKILLVGLYVPNDAKESFFNTLQKD